jgi:hypothetical protein
MSELRKANTDHAFFLTFNVVGWIDLFARKECCDIIIKMETVIEEADETLFWLEMIEESKIINHQSEIINLKKEVNELISIFVASVKTVKNRLNQKSSIPNQK